MSALAAVLKRDRWIIGAALGLIAAVAWVYLWSEARRMQLTGVCECAAMKIGGPDLNSWSPAALLPLFLMWAVMMVAMMLPSAAPMMLTFAAVARNRRQQRRPYVSVAVFASGYLLVWFAFSAIAALAQWFLHRGALLSPMMVSTSVSLGAIVFLATGLYQFTRLKRSCLRHCRAPLEFIMTRWREGGWAAFRMGVEHGVACIGCCWILMLLLFVGGVMNMLWVAALTIVVALEKIAPRGKWISLGTGVALCLWGAWLLAHVSLGARSP